MPGSPTTPLAIVIPAGGGGTRLWPRSRKSRPKQFIDMLVPGRTMLQITVDRVAPELVPGDCVFVITAESHVEMVRGQLPDVPRQNIVGEPIPRDSAPAIGIMAALVETKLGPETVIAVLPADHDIANTAGFQSTLSVAADAAAQGYLVTLGIAPTTPDTGFGYIQQGSEISTGSTGIYDVAKFCEKPDREAAEEYLADGRYYWNAGMFVATARRFRELYQTHLPEMEAHLNEIAAVFGTPQQETTFARIFPQLPKISFDFAIAEKADRVAVVPVEIGWSDVGSWSRLADVLQHTSDGNDNIAFGAERHKLLDTRGSLIYSPDKMVAAVGLDNIIVVDTPDVLLVASRDRSEDVKKIVESLELEGRRELL